MKSFDPFKNLILDKEEQAIEDALERGEFKSVGNYEERKKIFEEAAKYFIELQKTKRITLRVNNSDLIKVKAKAKRSKIPYQRLLKVLIHKYADGETYIRI